MKVDPYNSSWVICLPTGEKLQMPEDQKQAVDIILEFNEQIHMLGSEQSEGMAAGSQNMFSKPSSGDASVEDTGKPDTVGFADGVAAKGDADVAQAAAQGPPDVRLVHELIGSDLMQDIDNCDDEMGPAKRECVERSLAGIRAVKNEPRGSARKLQTVEPFTTPIGKGSGGGKTRLLSAEFAGEAASGLFRIIPRQDTAQERDEQSQRE